MGNGENDGVICEKERNTVENDGEKGQGEREMEEKWVFIKRFSNNV